MVALETMIGLGAMISLGSISMISLGAMFSFRAMICLIEHVSKLERGGYPNILAVFGGFSETQEEVVTTKDTAHSTHTIEFGKDDFHRPMFHRVTQIN